MVEIGIAQVVGKVEGKWQALHHARPRGPMGDGETDYTLHQDEFDIYYVDPKNTEGPCGVGQKVLLFKEAEDGDLRCRAHVEG